MNWIILHILPARSPHWMGGPLLLERTIAKGEKKISLPHSWSSLWQTLISSSTGHTQTEDAAEWRNENDKSLDALNIRATLRAVHRPVNLKEQPLP